jgi:uncharacterized protein YdcH (DUF465 family)
MNQEIPERQSITLIEALHKENLRLKDEIALIEQQLQECEDIMDSYAI